jgi:hypothetical protein
MRTEIDPEHLTSEDREIWVSLTTRGGRLYPILSMWERSALADERDARKMLWIERQAGYARKQDQRYGRGKRLRHVHPLARIGMSYETPS